MPPRLLVEPAVEIVCLSCVVRFVFVSNYIKLPCSCDTLAIMTGIGSPIPSNLAHGDDLEHSMVIVSPDYDGYQGPDLVEPRPGLFTSSHCPVVASSSRT